MADLYSDFFIPAKVIDLIFLHYDFPSSNNNGLFLDVGCGRGDKTESFRRIGRRVIGIDINSNHIEKAEMNFPLCSFMVGSIQELPFKSSSFDFIFSYSTLQYVEWPKVTRECQRVLKSNGKAVFIENLEGSPFARIYRTIRKSLKWKYLPYLTPRSHIRWDQRKEFEKGFSKVDFTAFNLITPLGLIIPPFKLFRGVRSTTYRLLHKVDSYLLHRFPILRNYCWSILICASK